MLVVGSQVNNVTSRGNEQSYKVIGTIYKGAGVFYMYSNNTSSVHRCILDTVQGRLLGKATK